MPLIQLDQLPVREIFPGLRARLIHSERVSHSWVDVDAGATFPEHRHPHEQIVSVLAGELELVVEGVTHTLRPGVVFVIPPHAPHSRAAVRAGAGCSMRLRLYERTTSSLLAC
jgi:quercetin dioxygenase-like cupin family protein